jgi:hypothetical protein
MRKGEPAAQDGCAPGSNALTSSRISRQSAGANDRRGCTQINLIFVPGTTIDIEPMSAQNGGFGGARGWA